MTMTNESTKKSEHYGFALRNMRFSSFPDGFVDADTGLVSPGPCLAVTVQDSVSRRHFRAAALNPEDAALLGAYLTTWAKQPSEASLLWAYLSTMGKKAKNKKGKDNEPK